MSKDHIQAVNTWRGECLDTFARVEQAIIKFIEQWQKIDAEAAPALAEAASARTRNLTQALGRREQNDQDSKKLIKLLELWAYRERDRNDLVHGVFTVKSNGEGWAVINRTVPVKKQVSSMRESLTSAAEAQAFLSAIKSERKALEESLKAQKLP